MTHGPSVRTIGVEGSRPRRGRGVAPRRGARRHCDRRRARDLRAAHASSRPCWSDGTSARRPTSRRASAGSALSPTRCRACAAIEDACGVAVDDRIEQAPPPPVLRRVDPEPRAARLPAPRPRLLRLRATPSSWPSSTAAAVERGLRLKKHRQPDHGDRRRPGDPPRQRPSRRFLPGPRPRGDRRAGRAAAARPGGVARDGRRGSPGFDFPDIEADYRFVALSHPAPLRDRSGPPASSDGIDASAGRVRRPRRRGARRALVGPPLPAGRARPVPHGTARPLRAQRRSCPAGRRGRARGRPRPGLHEPVQEHHRARRRAPLRLRRGARASSTDYEPPDPPAARSCRGAAVGHRGHRGTAGPAPAPLRARRRRDDPVGADHAPHVAEPAHDRVRPPPGGRVRPRAERCRAERRCELAIRNHDPCISCAAHFLDVSIDRS